MSTLPSTMKAVAYTGEQQVAFVDWPFNADPLLPNEVAGRTLATLISPGTETSGGLAKPRTEPVVAGYAAVFEVTAIGSAVADLKPGQRVFCMGGHAAWQRQHRADIVPLPDSLAADVAAFCRFMGVSWSTLTTTRARPADRVLVTGLGLVGNLAAQMFQSAGYRVTAVDPLESRRALANRIGLADTRPTAAGQADLTDAIAIAVECSGHEQAVLDGLRVVRKGGEVVLIGVPWRKRAEVTGFDVLHAVFHRYVTLRSGWEWELPRQPGEFQPWSIYGNLAHALDWLAAGRVRVEGLYHKASPVDAQAAYTALLKQQGDFLSIVFDWASL